MFYSISNSEKFNAIKKDVQGSIVEGLENLFKKSHVAEIRTEGSRTYIVFEWIDENGERQKDTTFFDSRLFAVSE